MPFGAVSAAYVAIASGPDRTACRRSSNVYSPGQVGLATFLAGPLVGGILLAMVAIGASERAPNYLALHSV